MKSKKMKMSNSKQAFNSISNTRNRSKIKKLIRKVIHQHLPLLGGDPFNAIQLKMEIK